jgi:hypothetical protein
MSYSDSHSVELAKHDAKDAVNFKAVHDKLDDLKKAVKQWGMIGGFVGGALAMGIHLLGGCNVVQGRPTMVQVGTYGEELQQCIADNDARAATDECRAEKRAAWCARFPNEENCPKDAGAE